MLIPDWKKKYSSIKAIEKDLINFRWKGDGWYLGKTDTLLIIQLSPRRWMVYCWNSPKAYRNILSTLALPMRF